MAPSLLESLKMSMCCVCRVCSICGVCGVCGALSNGMSGSMSSRTDVVNISTGATADSALIRLWLPRGNSGAFGAVMGSAVVEPGSTTVKADAADPMPTPEVASIATTFAPETSLDKRLPEGVIIIRPICIVHS